MLFFISIFLTYTTCDKFINIKKLNTLHSRDKAFIKYGIIYVYDIYIYIIYIIKRANKANYIIVAVTQSIVRLYKLHEIRYHIY